MNGAQRSNAAGRCAGNPYLVAHHNPTYAMLRFLLLFSLLTAATDAAAQVDLTDYTGGWSGELPALDAFRFRFTLQQQSDGRYRLETKGKTQQRTDPLEKSPGGLWTTKVNGELEVTIDLNREIPHGFIRHGHHLSPLYFQEIDGLGWQAVWNLFLAERFDPTFYLSLDAESNSRYSASTFFQSPVCHYMYGQEFERAEDHFVFRDVRSDLRFTGTPTGDEIQLSMSLLGETLVFPLRRLDYDDWRIAQADRSTTSFYSPDNWLKRRLDPLLRDIQRDSLVGTHSILVARGDSVLFEAYFSGFDPVVAHDTRSLSKSFAS